LKPTELAAHFCSNRGKTTSKAAIGLVMNYAVERDERLSNR